MASLLRQFWFKPLLGVLGLLVLLLMSPPLFGIKAVYLWTDRLIFVLVAGIIFLIAYVRTREHLRQPWLQVFRQRTGLAALTAWTGLIWLASVLANHVLLLSLGLDLPIEVSLLLLAILQAGISVNLVPGTIGIFEYICVQTLALYDVPQPIALGYGVLLHAVVMIPLLAGGIWALGSRIGKEERS